MISKKLIIFMPSIEGGGVEKNLFVVSNYLASHINNVSIITVSAKYKRKFKKKINFITTKFKTFDRLGRKAKYFIALFLLLKEIIKDKKLTVFCFQANIYCTILCKLMGVKIILRSNSSPSGWSQNFLKNIIFKIVLNLADKVMVNSLEFKKELDLKFGIKSICIYNPLNIQEIVNKSKEKCRFNFFDHDKKSLKIINVGRFVIEQKDQITLLKSINQIKSKISIKLLLVGRGIDYDNIRDYIKTHKLEKNVKIIKFQRNPYKFIAKSDLFVLSSRFEGLPNVLLEAACLKKFIISSNCPTGPSEILKNGKNGDLFEVGDYKNLSYKILKFNKTNSIIQKKIFNNYRDLHRFDLNTNLKKYLTLISQYIY